MKQIAMGEALNLLKEAEEMGREDRLKLQEDRLRELASYAKEYSPYFRELYKDIDCNDIQLKDLPPTDKESLTREYRRWVTDPEITTEGVATYLKEGKDQLYLGKYSGLTTSGTSGVPMPMLRDAYHNTIHGAMVNRRLVENNIPPRWMSPEYSKIASIIYNDPKVSSYRSFLKAKNAIPQFADRMQAFSPSMPVAELTAQMEAYQPEVVTCYPSAMCALAIEQKKGNLHLDPKAILCSAEVLTEEMFRLFTETFRCPILNNYCSTEGGEAAMSCGCGHLHVNEDWVIIEPVDRNMNPVTDPSQWSEGVLITDLSNYVQPVIRYYMNDQIRLHETCDCGSTFPYMEIMGRAGGVAEICGRTIMVANLSKVLEFAENVYGAQLVQTAPDALEIRALCVPGIDTREVFSDIEGKLREILDREQCEGYQIAWSSEEPIRNNRGGKLQKYIRMF